MKKLFVSIFMYMLMAVMSMAEVDADLKVDDPDSLIYALIRAENQWLDPNRVGDKDTYHKAFGLLQVRKPYLDDVNRIVGPKAMKKMWGKSKMVMADMKDTNRAVWATKIYLVYWGKQYEKKTKKKVTPEIYARIHNGGPTGWQKWITIAYWHKVKSRMVESFVAVNNKDADTINLREVGG